MKKNETLFVSYFYYKNWLLYNLAHDISFVLIF